MVIQRRRRWADVIQMFYVCWVQRVWDLHRNKITHTHKYVEQIERAKQ